MRQHSVAYIGLGSNLGSRERNLRRALEELDKREGIEVARASSFIETEPVGGPPQGRFLNAAAELHTTLRPRELLAALQDVENRFGRTHNVRWGPRTLDLDLLLYDDRVLEEPGLEVPHPRMHRRRFVLEPLSEIAPDAVHPILGKTVRRLYDDLAEREGC